MLDGQVVEQKKERTSIRRRILGRFIKDKRGSVAIEFSMLALPFSALVFAILESCISFAAQQLMANATEDLVRDLRTNVMKQADATSAAVRSRICADLSLLVSAGCPGLYIDLKSYTNFADIPTTIPYTSTGDLNTAGFTVAPGAAQSKNNIRVFYKWPVYTDFMSKYLANLPDGKTLLFTTLTWKTEKDV